MTSESTPQNIEDPLTAVPSQSEQAKHDEIDKDSKLLAARAPRSQTAAPWNSLSMLWLPCEET